MNNHLQCNICSHQNVCSFKGIFERTYEEIDNMIDKSMGEVVFMRFELYCDQFLKQQATEKNPAAGVNLR